MLENATLMRADKNIIMCYGASISKQQMRSETISMKESLFQYIYYLRLLTMSAQLQYFEYIDKDCSVAKPNLMSSGNCHCTGPISITVVL